MFLKNLLELLWLQKLAMPYLSNGTRLVTITITITITIIHIY